MKEKIKKFFDYNVKLVENAKLKYEIVRLNEDNERKSKEIDEWKDSFKSQEERVKKFKNAYRTSLNEREDIVKKYKSLEREKRKIEKELRRYEQAKIVFERK